MRRFVMSLGVLALAACIAQPQASNATADAQPAKARVQAPEVDPPKPCQIVLAVDGMS